MSLQQATAAGNIHLEQGVGSQSRFELDVKLISMFTHVRLVDLICIMSSFQSPHVALISNLFRDETRNRLSSMSIMENGRHRDAVIVDAVRAA